LGMVLCWHDHALYDPVNAGNCEAANEEFQMVPDMATRFWEASQDSCIVERGVP
jgi:hypothetical protein